MLQSGPCAETRAHDVADHSADAGSSAAEGFDRGRVVVRLDLDAEAVAFVEFDHARVVHEHADAERVVDPDRRLEDRLFEQVVVAAAALHLDATGQGLVLAVLGPCLGDRLELGERRSAAEAVEVLLHLAHLDRVQREAALLAQLDELVVGQASERQLDAALTARAAGRG